MRFDELKDEQWDIVKAIYKEAFPKVERKPFSRVKKDLKMGTRRSTPHVRMEMSWDLL